jgi:hypothetical protein
MLPERGVQIGSGLPGQAPADRAMPEIPKDAFIIFGIPAVVNR